MLKRLYVHNFRCLENFDLAFGAEPSVLLIGRNGSGKTTVALALDVLKRVAQGTNRVGDLVTPKDITQGRTQVPVRFAVDVVLAGQIYSYSLAFEYPHGFRELRVLEETLLVEGAPIFQRELSQVRLARTGFASEAAFRIDWHLVGLPIIQEQNSTDPLAVFKHWLSGIYIFKPVPSLFRGESDLNFLRSGIPGKKLEHIGAWFSAMTSEEPQVYSEISHYLAQIMPDFVKITNFITGKDSRSLVFHFGNGNGKTELALDQLSDGEKCFVVYALIIAANSAFGPILCFWDEPDNFLSPDEVGHAMLALRRAFKNHGQLIVTSHNSEAIRRFSDNNTLHLSRKSHLEPTVVTSVEGMRAGNSFEGGLVDALIRGDVNP